MGDHEDDDWSEADFREDDYEDPLDEYETTRDLLGLSDEEVVIEGMELADVDHIHDDVWERLELTNDELELWDEVVDVEKLFAGETIELPWRGRTIKMSVIDRRFRIELDNVYMPKMTGSLNQIVLELDPGFFIKAPVPNAVDLWAPTIDLSDED